MLWLMFSIFSCTRTVLFNTWINFLFLWYMKFLPTFRHSSNWTRFNCAGTFLFQNLTGLRRCASLWASSNGTNSTVEVPYTFHNLTRQSKIKEMHKLMGFWGYEHKVQNMLHFFICVNIVIYGIHGICWIYGIYEISSSLPMRLMGLNGMKDVHLVMKW